MLLRSSISYFPSLCSLFACWNFLCSNLLVFYVPMLQRSLFCFLCSNILCFNILCSNVVFPNISPASVVGFRRKFVVESKIKLNLLEGLLLRKKNLGRHSRYDWFSLWVSGQSKTSVTKYELIRYHWLGHFMQNKFYKRSVHWN